MNVIKTQIIREDRKPSRDGLSLMPWSARFDDPIPVPKGKPLVTLKDAGNYITKLPKARPSMKPRNGKQR
jgi:hypothetical protein